MDPTKRAAAHGKQGRVAAPAPGGAVAAPTSPAGEERDLDQSDVQQQILEPKPLQVTIGGKPVELHELPAKRLRQFVGLFAQVMSEVTGRKSSGVSASFRIVGVLTENEEFSNKFVGYVARALFEPAAAPTAEQIQKAAVEIDEQASFTELAGAFAKMAELNRVTEAFGAPN